MINIIERAYQLAKSGDCASLHDIRDRLKSEGYSRIDEYVSGPALSKSLRELCQAARRK